MDFIALDFVFLEPGQRIGVWVTYPVLTLAFNQRGLSKNHRPRSHVMFARRVEGTVGSRAVFLWVNHLQREVKKLGFFHYRRPLHGESHEISPCAGKSSTAALPLVLSRLFTTGDMSTTPL